MIKKQVIALLLVMVSLTANILYAEFTDIGGHWGEQVIQQAAEIGIIKGRSDTQFDPDGEVTCAEFTVMCVRALNQETTIGDEDSFSDVTKNDWFYTEIESAVQLGLIYKADKFFPNDPITRERMATIAYRAYGKDAQTAVLDFSDAEDISDWAREPIAKSITAGLINGMGDGTFQPKANLTRAQSAAIVSRLYDKLPGNGGSPSPTEEPIPGITSSPAMTPSVSPSPGSGNNGGGGGGGNIPIHTPSPAVSGSPTESSSPSISPEVPSVNPSVTPNPSQSPDNPAPSPDEPIISGNTVTFSLDDNWTKGPLPGPQINGTAVSTYSTVKKGASVVYQPKIASKYYAAVWVYVVNEGTDSDTDVKYQVFHNGRVDEFRINMALAENGYYFAGIYDFAGTGKGNEYVKVSRTSDGTAKTTISAIRFDLLREQTDVINPIYNQDSEVESSIYVIPKK